MVTPETTGTDDPKRESAGWRVPAALLLVVAGLAAVFSLTTPEPPPPADALPTAPSTIPGIELPSTTTTIAPFRVADIVSGQQIDWIGRESFVGRHVLDVIPRGKSFHIFTTSTWNDERGFEGILSWVSADGTSWHHLGGIDSRFSPTRVIEAGPGFLAYGTDPGNQPMVWLSADGRDWEEAALPHPQPGTTTWFSGAHGVTDDRIVLIADEYSHPGEDAVNRAVDEHYPGFYGRNYPIRPTEEPMIVITGPLGIAVAVHDAEDLGLLTDDLDAVPITRLVSLIGSPDGRSWNREVIADTARPDTGVGYLGAIHHGPDGRLWAQGWSPSTPSGWDTYASSDAVDWVEIETALPDWLVPWGDRYVTINPGSGGPRLRVSDDLESWTNLFQPTVLPRGHVWALVYPPALAAGPAGVAVTARSAKTTHETLTPALERDGYRLEASPNDPLVLFKGEEAVISTREWQPTSTRRPARIGDDGDSLVFLDPDTGEDLVGFTVEELKRLERERNAATRTIIDDDHHVLFFSPDGENWTVQDLGEIVAGDVYVRLVVGDGRILVLAQSPTVTVVWTGIAPRSGGG